MSKTDFAFISVLLFIMLFCFYMNTKWWFFFAGICASATFAISIGYWLQGLERVNNEKNWNNFLDNMQEETKTPELKKTANLVSVEKEVN